MMTRTLLIAAGAALLASTNLASAQVRDDPPGWAFQWRGIQAEKGYHPDEAYRAGFGDNSYYDYGYDRPYYRYAPRARYWNRDRWDRGW